MRTNWIKRLSYIFIPILSIGIVILIVDTLSFFLLPKNLTTFAPGYRVTSFQRKEMPDYARGYPRYYFRADDLLGFDIQPNVSGMKHVFDDASFDIFSNELGCFDKNTLDQIRKSSLYTYFAGDSFTWGYASYAKKFATVYESKSNQLSVKCGVTHTGQIHQYNKFLRITKIIGRYPKRVFVGYFSNDPANDFAHPHTTVIKGFQVDVVKFKNGVLIKQDMNEVSNKIDLWENSKSTSSNHTDTYGTIKAFLHAYSITANLINLIKTKINTLNIEDESFYAASNQFSFKYNYDSSEITQKNREAIITWASHAKEHSYELIFLLIPNRENFNDISYYQNLKKFLDKNGVTYYDLSDPFLKLKKLSSQLYWEKDQHFSNDGNEFVGELLAERYK